jgi:hypothetical protein
MFKIMKVLAVPATKFQKHCTHKENTGLKAFLPESALFNGMLH